MISQLNYFGISIADAPGSPGEPNVEEVGGDFVSLTWSKPTSDGGGGIKGYIIEKKDVNTDKWVRVNQKPTSATIFNVPNLIEDREYEFRIFAVNEAGESRPSMGSKQVKVKDPKGMVLMIVFSAGPCASLHLLSLVNIT